jgi:hypothetical protein
VYTPLRHLCQDIGFGYKIVIHELVNKGGGFLTARNLPLALLGAMHSLGLQLVDCFAAYRRAPRSLWSECLALYRYARDNRHNRYAASLPGFGELQIDASFRLIALIRLADPYALPAATVPALQTYLAQRIALSTITSQRPTDRNSLPVDDAFLHAVAGEEPGLYIDIHELLGAMKSDLGRLAQYRQAKTIGLPEEVPAPALLRCLRQTLEHWQQPPTRAGTRTDAHTRVEMVIGLEAAYCVTNRGRRFDPSLFVGATQDNIDLGAHPAPEHATTITDAPEAIICSSINRSQGGLAVSYRGQQVVRPRVGQLVALRRPGSQAGAGWVVAVCRWLVEPDSGDGFDVGLQYLAREPRPLVVRVADPQGRGSEHQPAIGARQKRTGQPVHTLITRSGGVGSGALITIFEPGGNRLQARCSEHLESGPGFERCIYVPV